jgi:hypothetical protein
VSLPTAFAQDGLPLVTEVEWKPFREHVRALLAGLERRGQAPPGETVQALRELLDREPVEVEQAVVQVQKLLDPLCLVGVHINPESRVKAARGTAPAKLQRDRERLVLVKLHNEGGVTSTLRVTGPQLTNDPDHAADAWLGATLAADAPLTAKLTGRGLQYLVLVLKAREAGKREALFRFDVGQGTQDLGFRAEVPVLFTVTER